MVTSAANPASSLFYLEFFAGITRSGADDPLGTLVAALLFGNSPLIWYSVVARALEENEEMGAFSALAMALAAPLAALLTPILLLALS